MTIPYRLLETFRQTFQGRRYRHRSSTTGDKIAGKLYEDLVLLGRSRLYGKRITELTHGTSRWNKAVGIPMRRGDAVFGEFVPGIIPVGPPSRIVASGSLATIEIGAEIKILAKAMIKQIDRVMSDTLRQAEHFRSHGNPICVGLVGINHAACCTSYEGRRAFRTDGTSGFPHPSQEAPEAERRIRERVIPAFDFFLILPYAATNERPYDFGWIHEKQTAEEYGALLTRLSIAYDERFRAHNGV